MDTPPNKTTRRLHEMAVEVGLNPDDAMNMTLVDFARIVSMRRATREARAIALSTLARAIPDRARIDALLDEMGARTRKSLGAAGFAPLKNGLGNDNAEPRRAVRP